MVRGDLKMKNLTKTLITGALLSTSLLTHAESPHEFSGNVAVTTDYVFRGISQSNEDPALSGGFDYAHESGIYAGFWASSIEFNTAGNSDDASTEMDYYLGYGGEFAGTGISFDIGGLYFAYPDQNEDTGADFDYYEIYGSVGYSFNDTVSTGLYVAYSPDFFGEDDRGIYVAANFDLALPQNFGLSFIVGHQDVEGDKSSTGFDYSHWSLGLAKEVGIFGFDLTYHDTFSRNDIDGDALDSRLVFTVSSSW